MSICVCLGTRWKMALQVNDGKQTFQHQMVLPPNWPVIKFGSLKFSPFIVAPSVSVCMQGFYVKEDEHSERSVINCHNLALPWLKSPVHVLAFCYQVNHGNMGQLVLERQDRRRRHMMRGQFDLPLFMSPSSVVGDSCPMPCLPVPSCFHFHHRLLYTTRVVYPYP